MRWLYAILLIAIVLTSLLLVWTPVSLRQSDVAQSVRGIEIMYTLGRWNRVLTPLLLALGLALVYRIWKTSPPKLGKALLSVASLGLCAPVVVAWSNTLEWRFHRIETVETAEVSDATHLADDDMILGVVSEGEARAYAVRQVIYHHVVNDVVAGVPIAVTFCALCHTGVVWSAIVEEQVLHFRMIARNNQNFVMEDEETGTWWQQASGEAILGPLKGKRLDVVPFELVSYGIWKKEHPNSLVLLPVEEDRSFYAPPNWDERMRNIPPVTPADPKDPLGPKELVVGLSIDARSKAYPMELLIAQSPVADRVASREIVLVVATDGKSVRAFDRKLDGKALDLFLKPDSDTFALVDAETGSEWDFSGTAVSGPLEGRQLDRLQTIQDYWFDWKRNHPETRVYALGRIR